MDSQIGVRCKKQVVDFKFKQNKGVFKKTIRSKRTSMYTRRVLRHRPMTISGLKNERKQQAQPTPRR